MEKYVDVLLDSMVKHDASLLPMADRYSATENGIAAAVSHMTCWRTIQKINCVTHKVLDPVLCQVVVVAQADEGGYPTLMAARIKVEKEKISAASNLNLLILKSCSLPILSYPIKLSTFEYSYILTSLYSSAKYSP